MSLPPITWLPSPFRNARDSRYPIRAEVKHRIVGTLPGARIAFGVAPGTSRNASTHFGIGYVGGKLTIDQYVDLSDMAWGNGDVRDPTWSRIIPGVNPNLYTVSTEHEDGGSANRGRVSEAVWQASMQLSRLLRCGDVARIRAAGIRVRSTATVAQLAAMPIDTGSYIDHHQIAGPNKPYCFRRWLDDPGFVEGSPSRRTRLLAYLNAEDDVQIRQPIVTEEWMTRTGEASRFTRPDGTSSTFSASVRVKSVAELTLADGTDARLLDYGDKREALIIRRIGIDPIAGTRTVGSPVASGVSKVEYDAALDQISALSARITAKDAYWAKYPKG
jgi:hypothetical protein